VYHNIQGQIDRQLSALSAADISQRRRSLLEDFVKTKSTLKGGGSSSGSVAAADHSMLTYKFRDSHDPLKLELNTAVNPADGHVGTKPQLCRSTLSTTLWNQLHSTPYGRFDRMITSATPLIGPNGEAYCVSRVPFDHYNIARDRESLLRELPRGKRTAGLEQAPSRIFDVV